MASVMASPSQSRPGAANTMLGALLMDVVYAPHLCGTSSRILVARRKKAAAYTFRRMDPRQRPIADWMNAVMAEHHLSARAWADKAKLGKDTVSRAVREDYAHVTSTRTIAKLAEAVGETPPGAAAAIPSGETFASILAVLLPAAGLAALPAEDVLLALGRALRDTLLELADDAALAGDPSHALSLARVSARQIARLVS